MTFDLNIGQINRQINRQIVSICAGKYIVIMCCIQTSRNIQNGVPEYMMQDTEYRIQETEYIILNTGDRKDKTIYQKTEYRYTGDRIPVYRRQNTGIQDTGDRIPVYRIQEIMVNCK